MIENKVMINQAILYSQDESHGKGCAGFIDSRSTEWKKKAQIAWR
jgi:hypothetical protein